MRGWSSIVYPFFMTVLIFLLILKQYPEQREKERWIQPPRVFEYKLGDPNEYNPEPRLIRNFLSQEETEALVRESDAKGFHNSLVEDQKEKNHIRKSETCWLYPKDSEILRKIYHRVLTLPELREDDEDSFSMEPCQIVRYRPGGHYIGHYDQCHLKSPYCVQQIEEHHGPRKWTLIMYLCDEFDGGETKFIHLDRKYKGNKGDALLFHSLTPDNLRVHPLSFHQGTEVLNGEKRIANVWIRTKSVVAS